VKERAVIGNPLFSCNQLQIAIVQNPYFPSGREVGNDGRTAELSSLWGRD
jgi:hypothetical protein